jgi:proline iminopeptidase
LAYEVRGKGTGRPLVVINGGPGFDHTQLLLVPTAWDRLAQNRSVVFYDQRGTGRSFALKPGAPDTLEDQMADLESLRVHFKAETMDVLGHSSGGFIALAYAARHGAQVSHLVLVDSQPPKTADAPSLFGEIFPDVVERQRAAESAKERGDKDAPAELRRLRRTMLFYSPDNRDLYLKLAQGLAFSQQVNTALGQDMDRVDLTPDVKRFKMPVLVVTGRLDVVVPPATAHKMHQEIPGSRFVVFERSGHLPYFEEPDAFAREVEAFLGK